MSVPIKASAITFEACARAFDRAMNETNMKFDGYEIAGRLMTWIETTTGRPKMAARIKGGHVEVEAVLNGLTARLSLPLTTDHLDEGWLAECVYSLAEMALHEVDFIADQFGGGP